MPPRSPALPTVPDVIVLGHYGRQRWERGRLSSPAAPPGLAVARADLPAVLASAGADPGTWIEDKGEAVAVHTRRAAQPQAELDRLRAPLAELAGRTGLASSLAGWCSSCGRPAPTKGRHSASWSLSGIRLPSCSAATTSATGPRSRPSATCAPRACPGCWWPVAQPRPRKLIAADADLVVSGPTGIAELLTGLADAFAASRDAARLELC